MKSKPIRHVWGKNWTMEEWTQERMNMEGANSDFTRIGASDVAVITGHNPWKCKQRLFYHLTGYYSHFQMSETLLAGHLMEGVTIKRWEGFVLDDEQQSLYNTHNGLRIRKAKKANFFLTNPKYDWLFVSLDYTPQGKVYSPYTGELYQPLTPIELKHSNFQYHKNWPDGIATQYRYQINTQMLVADVDVAIFCVLVDGVKFHTMEVYRDPIICEEIAYETKKFADIVTTGKMILKLIKEAETESEREQYQELFESITPEPMGMSPVGDNKNGDNTELMFELYPEANDLMKLAEGDDDMLLSRYVKCNKTLKEINKHKDLIKCKLVASCGDFEGITGTKHRMLNRRGSKFKKPYFDVR